VECCLQERSWNAYYSHLLHRLLASSKAHRVTLQYCLWDQFKLVEQTDMRRLINLAHLTAQLIASFTLSASILKVGRCSCCCYRGGYFHAQLHVDKLLWLLLLLLLLLISCASTPMLCSIR